MEEDISRETGGFYKRVLISCLQANKPELTHDQIEKLKQHGPGAVVSVNQARAEAEELYNAGEKF